MAKPRKENTRSPNYRIFILCEGEKTEPNYFEEIIREVPLPPDLIKIQIVKTTKNTSKELVQQAKGLKETAKDQVWVVFDKDGYTHHPQAFNMAKANGIRIAFSSISFETWVLMHFRYTSASFTNSDKIISFMNSNNYFAPDGFKKNCTCLYRKFLKPLTNTAIENAKKLRKNMLAVHSGKKIYAIDSYTDVDLLLHEIKKAQTKFSR